MMKPLLAFFLFCGSYLIALGQNSDEAGVMLPLRPTFKFGGVLADMDNMNAALSANGYGQIKFLKAWEVNFTRKRARSNWGSTLGLIYNQADNNDQTTVTSGTLLRQNRTLKGYGIKAGADYYFVNRERIHVWIPLSMQWTKMKFTTFENIPFDFKFNSTQGVTENTYTSWKKSLELGVNFEYGLPVGDFIWLIGCNAGYRIDYGSNPWRYSDEIAIGFPKFQNEGFVWGISLGATRKPRRGNEEMRK